MQPNDTTTWSSLPDSVKRMLLTRFTAAIIFLRGQKIDDDDDDDVVVISFDSVALLGDN